MKVRNGFVSNSSSSSFLIMTKPQAWDKLLTENFSPLEIEVINDFTESTKLFGEYVFLTKFTTGNMDCFDGYKIPKVKPEVDEDGYPIINLDDNEDDYDKEQELEDLLYDIPDKLVRLARDKFKEDCWVNLEDM